MSLLSYYSRSPSMSPSSSLDVPRSKFLYQSHNGLRVYGLILIEVRRHYAWTEIIHDEMIGADMQRQYLRKH